MQIHFEPDPSLGPDDLNIIVTAATKNDRVTSLLNYLKKFNQQSSFFIPIKTEDRILTIKQADLIKVEITKSILSFYTKNAVIQTNGRLYQILTRLNENFVQVSKHGIININHLVSLEAGFTGNMIAKLNFNQRADVSRKYLPELERRLGL
ncbi:LytTR family transcriptional regulator [Limosilactobacillus reuteri]|uniref:LytTR family transcriptional regulator n=1 Tax=Limosilactobacillus reuteri TaxID=1598 RepID=A0AAW4X474_LIMRT|nr:LytTR family DNA-binding domain-containing protein [Limosilactobacillus reuteri]MCC4477184.1 LytTR family transcriptional regulator [Limosilactobacillus reuteri]MCC4479341.1 LytTR family transcriptional regulator [Limosilactobacillus reuteri]MCC4488518.1 LytTR family transcriptional regulator [Limosilactobacillus reuteri]MCC4493832.1 LytTR family transcriptional regulator [Limosilactobacillus reuteri]MCC4495594.1 LytTR family transcriptional regulator [Limosilactobacillus reuteri]